jgi:hypothetical protein
MVIKLPWVESYVGSNANLHPIKCKNCSEVERKDKLMFHKWDFFCKHASHKKAENIYWD